MSASLKKNTAGHVIIIGGGVAGLCSAYYLLKSGWKVTLLEQGDLNDNCSYGNAGMIVPSHFTPLAAPGMISQGIKWLFNSRSPFYVKPSLSLNLLSWGIKFMKNATDAHVNRSAPVLRDLNLLSKQLYEDMAGEAAFNFDLKNDGILMLYKTAKTGEEEIHLAAKARELGLDAVELSGKEVQALEPDISLNVLGAVHYRCDGHLYPTAFMHQLIAIIKELGADIRINTPVTGIRKSKNNIEAIEAAGESFVADKVVVTGGAWLGHLGRLAGLSLPLMPGKGYSFMTNSFSGSIKHPALLLEARVALTPMNGQIRLGGTMELAPVNHRINVKRVEGIVRAIPDYYTGQQIPMPDTDTVWHGFRPCSPDGLPYLGYSHKINNLVIAGGQGMMGMSLGPATGKLVADLLNEATLSADIGICSPDRFN